MVKPTKEQLKMLYPNVDVEYLSDHIDRKILLIEMEDKVISQIDDVINSFKEQITGVLFLPYSDEQKDKLIEQKFKDLEFQLASLEVDAVIQLHESSGNLYQWILEKHFGEVPTKEIGGEQVSRKKLLKQDIQNLVNKTVTKNQNIGSSIQTSLKSLEQGIKRSKQSENRMSVLNGAFNKAASSIKSSTRSVLQQSVYDAETGIEYEVSDDYQIVYYRVEVLDADICMVCMEIDGTINEVPLDLQHKNCRGIDVLLLQDIETGKYYDSSLHGYGHKIKTRSFSDKFEALSEKRKREMLGKSNYELYVDGKLNIEDFLDNGRQITNAEAKIISQLKGLKSEINTPQKVNEIRRYMDSLLGNKSISQMSEAELLAYKKTLTIQKQLYMNVPKKAYSKSKPLQSYIDAIDAKYDEINALTNKS